MWLAAGRSARGGCPRIENGPDNSRPENQRATRQRRSTGSLTVREPRPDRIQHRLYKKEKTNLERADLRYRTS